MHYLTFDFDLNVQITETVLQHPPNYVLYAPSKFKVAKEEEADIFTKLCSL